uniref:Uncharacterized protein n=1 Tax=Moniliophthora roreri TaxID=221103 RepID=A0A0W0FDN9_MONRR
MPNNQASNAPGLSQTVLTTLSALVKDWLQGFLDALQTYHRFVGVPPPHPSYPLPAEFPFEGLSEVFHWIQVVDDATQVNHNLPVKVSLLPGRADHWEPLLWVIHSGTTVIGSVELDRRIYADQSVVSIDPVFILESLILAPFDHMDRDIRDPSVRHKPGPPGTGSKEYFIPAEVLSHMPNVATTCWT